MAHFAFAALLAGRRHAQRTPSHHPLHYTHHDAPQLQSAQKLEIIEGQGHTCGTH